MIFGTTNNAIERNNYIIKKLLLSVNIVKVVILIGCVALDIFGFENGMLNFFVLSELYAG